MSQRHGRSDVCRSGRGDDVVLEDCCEDSRMNAPTPTRTLSKYQVRWCKLLNYFFSELCWGMSLTPYILSGIADMRLKQWLRTQILTDLRSLGPHGCSAILLLLTVVLKSGNEQ